ncbi:hypothetical protein V2J09_017483 [Rumex salicifolius]
MATQADCTEPVRSKLLEDRKSFENSNPNFASRNTIDKPSNSPQLCKSSGKFQKSAPCNPNPIIASHRNRMRERKFVVAKKKSNRTNAVKDETVNTECKCKGKINHGKCLCLAYENLRSSQDEFHKNWNCQGVDYGQSENGLVFEVPENGIVCALDGSVDEFLMENEAVNCEPEQAESPDAPLGNSSIKRRREKLMEEARESIPATGSGRVLHLVQAFEKLLTLPKKSEKKDEKEAEDLKRGMKWALPGLQRPKAPETLESSSSFCPENLVFTAESLGFGSQVSSSFDDSHGSSSRSSTGSVQSRRSSSISSKNVGGRKLKKVKKQTKVTSQKPFKLRTEERGKDKEEEFFKKLQEMTIQEDKQRIRIAQGLPWTTDEPEILIKPSVKEKTRPLDIKLRTDMRAVERADFDYQVAEKMCLIEQYRMERERQQKLAEEEEIKRLRKELVPKAQPMPYFDRPFLPKKSTKQPTIPRDPKFIQPQNKKMKSCLSWNDFNNNNIHAHQQ